MEGRSHRGKRVLLRALLVSGACVVVFELVERWSVAQPESSGELGMLGVIALMLAGMGWAVAPVWRGGGWRRVVVACGCWVGLVFAGHWVVYGYSWHVRPNLGWYEEPEWVSKHPEFQKQLRERIAQNRW